MLEFNWLRAILPGIRGWALKTRRRGRHRDRALRTLLGTGDRSRSTRATSWSRTPDGSLRSRVHRDVVAALDDRSLPAVGDLETCRDPDGKVIIDFCDAVKLRKACF